MILPPLAEDRAVTALFAPVSNTLVHEQALSVQLVFQPAVLTHTYRPPSSQTLLRCWSWMTGVTNRALGSQPGLGVSPSMAACAKQVGLTKSANECPPSAGGNIVLWR